MLTVYLDNCCYNRPFDDRRYIKNYLEREAVLLVMQKAFDGEFEIIGSDVVEREMAMISNPEKKEDVKGLYSAVTRGMVNLNESIVQRAKDIMSQSNIKAFDSLHLAAAEASADYFFTTDIKFAKACRCLELGVVVKSLVDFVLEANEYEYND